MGKLLSISQTSKYLNVSIDTLRLWDKSKKLVPLKTPGGHRRYDIEVLDDFLGKKERNTYGCLYEHLCSAQDIAYYIEDEDARAIEEIRVRVGDRLLKKYEEKAS